MATPRTQTAGFSETGIISCDSPIPPVMQTPGVAQFTKVDRTCENNNQVGLVDALNTCPLTPVMQTPGLKQLNRFVVDKQGERVALPAGPGLTTHNDRGDTPELPEVASHYKELDKEFSQWLLTYPPLHFVVCRLGSWHTNVFCLLPSQSSSGFWPYPLSPGLAISALVCLDFAFRLPSSAISFSWHHLYLASAHVRTISISPLFHFVSLDCNGQISCYFNKFLMRPVDILFTLIIHLVTYCLIMVLHFFMLVLKLKFRKYPTIHPHYSSSNCTISN